VDEVQTEEILSLRPDLYKDQKPIAATAAVGPSKKLRFFSVPPLSEIFLSLADGLTKDIHVLGVGLPLIVTKVTHIGLFLGLL